MSEANPLELIDRLAIEVSWYRKNGKYPNERIVTDANDQEYMIGDWAWNKNNRDKPEYIEDMIKLKAKEETNT